jgi:cell wall-associated NlpC family hydrolase
MSQSTILDPRTNAFRPDLADIALSGQITATRFVVPDLRQCVRGVLPLLAEPKPSSHMISQIRYGEFLDVFEDGFGDFAWVQNRTDRYVGYIPAHEVFSQQVADLSNRVAVLRTFIYPEPDIKTPPLDELTLGSYVTVVEQEGKFRKLADGGYIFADHIMPANIIGTADYVFTAGRLLNLPYLWGGRTSIGVDCSGLVQLALDFAGIDAPRDSDQQCEVFGQPLKAHWRDTSWQRGDLVFFPGHVGIMTNGDHMIHASAFDMKVVVEPLYDIVMRGNEVLAMGRL